MPDPAWLLPLRRALRFLRWWLPVIDLAAMRIAGWHGDMEALHAALLDERDKRLIRAYYEGKHELRIGRPCGCVKCVDLAAAPPITIVHEKGITP